MIEIAKLKELIALMAANDLNEIDLRDGEETISLRRGVTSSTVVNHQPVIYTGGATAQNSGGAAPMYAAPASAPAPAPAQAAAPAPAAAPVAKGPTIDSPMVGTCYLAANPDSPSFVKVGQQVGPDTVVCLIEAMKVFNEIKAEKAGTIEQVLVKNGEAVEFGQKLFSIKPA